MEYMQAKVPQTPSTNTKAKLRLLFQKLPFGRALHTGAASHLGGKLHDAVVTALPCSAIVQLLLKSGADPQHRYQWKALREPGSYWELALAAYSIALRENPSQEQAWGQVCGLMVRHRAPIRRKVDPYCPGRAVRREELGRGAVWSDRGEPWNLEIMKREA